MMKNDVLLAAGSEIASSRLFDIVHLLLCDMGWNGKDL